MSKKILALMIAVLMVLPLAAACTGEATVSDAPESTEAAAPESTPSQILEEQPEVQTPDPEGEAIMDTEATVIYNLGWGPENQMNPYYSPSYDYTRHIFCSPLVMFSTTADGVETMECILAEDVECNDDMTEFTIKLRPENKWHDGEPFTAHDVVYSATVFWYDDLFQYSMYYGRESIPGVWTEVDEYTVNVKYEEPYKDFLHFLDDSLLVAPAHIFEGITGEDLNTFNFEGAPIGSGPFKYVSHVESEYTQLERFDDYYEPALIKNLRLQYLTEDTMSVLAMQSGEIDITRTWDAITGELDNTEGVNVYRFPETRIDMLWFNQDPAMPYSDPYVRKAYACLINTDEICSSVLGGMGVPYHTFFYVNSECADPSITTIPYNIEQARAYLEEGGYTLDSEGYYGKDGKRLELDFCHTQGAGSDREKIGLVLQQNAKAAGIYMTVNNYDDESWSAKRDNNTFDIVIDYMRQGMTVTSCLADISYFGEGKADGGYGELYMGEYRDQILALTEEATNADAAGDKATAIAKAQEIAKLMVDEAICIPISGYVTAYCSQSDVHIEACCFDELQFLNRMWVEKSAE